MTCDAEVQQIMWLITVHRGFSLLVGREEYALVLVTLSKSAGTGVHSSSGFFNDRIRISFSSAISKTMRNVSCEQIINQDCPKHPTSNLQSTSLKSKNNYLCSEFHGKGFLEIQTEITNIFRKWCIEFQARMHSSESRSSLKMQCQIQTVACATSP